jgi:hypothetical protein
MTYSDAEIRESWRKAKDKENHVQVLAELNGTDVKTMGKKLVELGLISAPPAPKKPPFDEARAMELYNEGLCDLDIAECLGVSKETVGPWRRSKDLPPNRQTGSGVHHSPKPRKAKPVKTEPLPPTVEVPMTVRELLRILQVLEAGHPDAIIWIGRRMLQGVAFHTELDRDGKSLHSVVELMDGSAVREADA